MQIRNRDPARDGATRSGLRLTAAAEDGGRRLDELLAEALGVGRRAAARFAERARVNGRRAAKGQRLRAGDTIEVEADAGHLAAQDLDVVRQTADLLVLAKPAGLPTVALCGIRGDSLARRVALRFPECAAVGPVGESGLVHRLDTGTSGLLLAARTQEAYDELRSQFRSHAVEKAYLALVRGTPQSSLRINAPIGQHRHSRRRLRALEAGAARARYAARAAATQVQRLRTLDGLALVRATTTTGIRHQIRVHLSSVGHPLLNDPLYDRGRPVPEIPGFLLHASELRWREPSTGEAASAALDPPPAWGAILERLESSAS